MSMTEKAISEYQSRRLKRILSRLDGVRYDYARPSEDYDWITIKGQHTPIEDGNIVGGVGGKFAGKPYTGTKMQQSKKRQERLKAKEVPKKRRIGSHNSAVARQVKKTKTLDGLKAILRNEFGIQFSKTTYDEVNIDSSYDFGVVREAMTGLCDMLKDFPQLKYVVERVCGKDRGVACYNSATNRLALNPNYWNNGLATIKMHKHNSASGWWPKNASPASTMVHEAAHAMQNYISSRMGRTMEEYCDDIIEKAYKNLVKKGDKRKRFEMIDSICGQAHKNSKEAVSEAFADVYANGSEASSFSIEIRRLVANDYKKVS